MKEIRDIVKGVEAQDIGERAVLATVIDLAGSGYRLPGARMLISSDGQTVGTVSGGCLEADVMERAGTVLETGRPEVFTYDTTTDENSVFSMNMGCRGVLRILLEAVDHNNPLISELKRSITERETIVFATITAAEENSLFRVGGRFFGSDRHLDDRFPGIGYDLEAFARGGIMIQTVPYIGESGKVDVTFEKILPPVQLYILGAGADAVPLAEAAHGLGWQVTVCDHRPAFLTAERFPTSETLILLERDIDPNWSTDDRSAFVLMNHNYDRDKALLTGALRSNAFYVRLVNRKCHGCSIRPGSRSAAILRRASRYRS